MAATTRTRIRARTTRRGRRSVAMTRKAMTTTRRIRARRRRRRRRS
jgi:hypothetical protein